MALGDLMSSRFSQSSAAVSNHLDECSNHDYMNFVGQRRDRDFDTASSSYGNVTTTTTITTTATSMAYLPQTIVLCDLRHEAFEDCVPAGPSDSGLVSKWRPKDRMKTGCVALVLCLNISVDPPDVIKISPCARMECWIDPFAMAPQKALETIGKTLSLQYERWQPRARYKTQLDPTVEEVKKLCTTCRKYAKSERVLFHYNGHGVPKPTANGEIWLFNKSYTQYIPLPISDLDSWLKTPSIYVFDCSAAGMIVNAFIELQDWSASTSSGSSLRDCILLAACEAHETLPQSAEFPADVFTSCLTTPIKMALRWRLFSMAKRRVKRTVKQSASSPSSNIGGTGPNEPPIEKTVPFRDNEIERRSAVSRAIRDVETDELLTGLRLLRSYFSKEQQQTPVLQFFKENLPNLSIVKNRKDGQYEVQWKDKDGNLSMNQAGRDINKSLLHRMSIAYPDCSTAMQSFGGIEFSSKAVKTSLLGADNMQIRDFVLEEPTDTQMLGLQDGLQTPGASSHGGLSVGMTPKTLRLPKHGEMLLSVHGSPLGVYKEDMEAIHETEEG